ncbi:hypothetical protein PHYSODRAFT_467001, partial [Phytophthora sojae]
MISLSNDDPIHPHQVDDRSGLSRSELRAPDGPTEFRLEPGERYGWWVDHERDKDSHEVATVHGAVNDFRLQILLDTGASVSMISLDLARRLKIKLNWHKQIKVSGLGGKTIYISASTQVKITLGSRVVYVMDIWVANIGEGVDVLLGMNFMFCAGVRLCVREGLLQLPDEEPVLMYGDKVQRRQGMRLPVRAPETLYLRPGEEAVVRIRFGQANPQREVVWAGRGDRWVTKIVYGAKSWPEVVKVVNISSNNFWIVAGTTLAYIVEYGFFPTVGRFVRPGSRAYKGWQVMIYENT